MTSYLALLRGVNVGGKSLIKMAGLQAALTASGCSNVRTFIQSGNVFFGRAEQDRRALAAQVEHVIEAEFQVSVSVAVFTKADWAAILSNAPPGWSKDGPWKHNLFILIPPYNMAEVVASIGTLKPDLEVMTPGNGVLYQSLSPTLHGRTTTGKLAGSPAYKHLTIRNHRTASKLLTLF